MTYILGAKCLDGLVVIADKKVMLSSRSSPIWERKIVQPISGYPFLWSASGLSKFYDSFKDRFYVEMREKNPSTFQQLRIVMEEIFEEMASIHKEKIREGGLSILFAQRPGADPELWLIEESGTPERVVDYAVIGSGQPYGKLFL